MFFFHLITISSCAPEFQHQLPAMSPLMMANVNVTTAVRRRQRRLIIIRFLIDSDNLDYTDYLQTLSCRNTMSA